MELSGVEGGREGGKSFNLYKQTTTSAICCYRFDYISFVSHCCCRGSCCLVSCAFDLPHLPIHAKFSVGRVRVESTSTTISHPMRISIAQTHLLYSYTCTVLYVTGFGVCMASLW